MRNAMNSLYMTPIDYGGGPYMTTMSRFDPVNNDLFPGPSPTAGASTYGAGGGSAPGIRPSPSAPPMMFAPTASAYQEPMGFGSYDQMMGRPMNFMAGGGYRPPPVAPYGGRFGAFSGAGRGYSTYSPIPGAYGGLNPYGQMF
jgi:hypothetical protein